MADRKCPGCGKPLTGDSDNCISCEIRQQLLAARANREAAAWLDRYHAGEDPGPFPESAEQFGDGLTPEQRREWTARHVESAGRRHADRAGEDQDQDREPGPASMAAEPVTLHDRVSRAMWGRHSELSV